jgi:integrase
MSITRRGVNTYLIRVYTGLDPITKSRRSINETFRGTRREAEKREQVLKVEALRRPMRGSPNITVREFIAVYLKETANRRSELTRAKLRDMVDLYVVPYLGDHRISKVDTSVIQHFLDFLSAPKKEKPEMTSLAEESQYGMGLAEGTVRMIRGNLAAIFNYALRSKLIDDNPVSDSIPPPKPPPRGNPLTLEEALAFVSVKDCSWYGNAFTFNLQTGLRPSELMGLIWDDIDPVGRTLRVERACKWHRGGSRSLGKVKSWRSARVIELSDEHIAFLEEHREMLKRHTAAMKIDLSLRRGSTPSY